MPTRLFFFEVRISLELFFFPPPKKLFPLSVRISVCAFLPSKDSGAIGDFFEPFALRKIQLSLFLCHPFVPVIRYAALPGLSKDFAFFFFSGSTARTDASPLLPFDSPDGLALFPGLGQLRPCRPRFFPLSDDADEDLPNVKRIFSGKAARASATLSGKLGEWSFLGATKTAYLFRSTRRMKRPFFFSWAVFSR